MRSAVRKVFGVVAAGIALAALSTYPDPGGASAAPLYPASTGDVFYASPPDLASRPAGDVLAVRPMPALPIFPGAAVWQVKFASRNSTDQPIAAVTTVLVPPTRRPGGPLLSFQPIINALGVQCAPSRALYTGNPAMVGFEVPALNVALQRGWTVAIPDHLGPTSAYGAARLGGQITLDGIRAVQRVPELALTGSPVGLAGYSGGGMASAWAAALAPSYAPELKLVGVAAGGVPMNIAKIAGALGVNPHPVFGLAFAAALGLEREYPDRLPISEQLNPLGLTMRTAVANACTPEIIAIGAGTSAAAISTNTDLMRSAQAWEVLNENSLEFYPGVPNAPMFEWHSPTDALVPVDSIVNTLGRYCRAGAAIESRLFASPDHLSAEALGAPGALDYLDARFRGEPAPSNC